MDNDISAFAKKMKHLFITERKKYIIQIEDGSYTWKDKNFIDEMLDLHLERKRTYGIFCGEELTKFISFDVDIPSKEVVQSIYLVLNQIGISSEFIHTSWSGSKGYHVDVYFSDTLGYPKMVKLYDYVASKLLQKYPDLEEKKIECRPSPTQGLKLPLGVNRNNKNVNSNICWYVNIHDDFKPIETLDYILDIKPIDVNQIRSIIKRLPTIKSKSSSENNPVAKKDISKNAKHNRQVRTSDTLNSLENLFKNGLRSKGTRHKSLIKLAIWLNTRNHRRESCEGILRDWMKNQKKEYYDTPLEICFKEISRIVEGVYSKNIVLGGGKSKTQIVVSRNDLLTIHQYPKKFHKTINALFIHSKRFADESGQFYMTYKQIANSAPCGLRTAFNHIKELEESKVIKVMRSPILFDGETFYNLPNTYQLNLDFVDGDNDISITIKAPKLKEYSNTKTQLTLKAFPNKEWMDIDNILKKALLKKTKNQ
ncbi:helix-turn-helix domain-containing protein [Oceanobacillus salinisoli]|uniref:hypothetical protein n=1 Tax=Oceanobacillus salinisoli TaxID=2678611 RepID=UPI0012E2946B|nr:hypothetical protein [Oceanobacillus salinisoli]